MNVRAIATGLLAAALFAGCIPKHGGSPTNGAVIAAGDQYVALGDSYSSGPRIGTSTGPPSCEQSDANYAHLLAERMGLELTDVTCGGADTEDLESSQKTLKGDKVPPQLDALDEDTDLVTLSIGGNDKGVFGNLITICAGLATKDPHGAPCATLSQADEGKLATDLAALAGRIEGAVDEVVERAPNARVVVVGYPQIVPESGPCPELPLATGDLPFAREVLRKLAEAQQEGAEAAGAEFVDVWAATDGHDICGEDPWIAGLVPDPDRGGAPFHPYPEEQEAVADLLQKHLS